MTKAKKAQAQGIWFDLEQIDEHLKEANTDKLADMRRRPLFGDLLADDVLPGVGKLTKRRAAITISVDQDLLAQFDRFCHERVTNRGRMFDFIVQQLLELEKKTKK